MLKSDVLDKKNGFWLVSSCLVGLRTRYDGKRKPNETCLQFLADKTWIPVCPEQLGGLATPRVPAKITHGNGDDVLCGKSFVVTQDGVDVSCEFIAGAKEVIQLISLQNIVGMCVKSRSPSCGLHEILGVTSALLLSKGLFLKEF